MNVPMRHNLILLLALILLSSCGAPPALASAAPLIAEYERAGVVFSSAPLEDGTPRLTGVASDGLLVAEFVGPKEHPRHAALIVSLSRRDVEAQLGTFARALLPDWSARDDWVRQAVARDASAVTVGNRRVELQRVEEQGDRVLLFTIRQT